MDASASRIHAGNGTSTNCSAVCGTGRTRRRGGWERLEILGKSISCTGTKGVDDLQHILQLVHHLRHRDVESRLHGVPQNPLLRPDASEASGRDPAAGALGCPGTWRCSTARSHPLALAIVGLRRAEWRVYAARAWAIDCCSCRQAARSRRPLRRWAAPVTGCQLRSIVKSDTNKKKGHAWDRRLVVVVLLCVVVCGCVSLCVAVRGCVWLCVVVCGCGCGCGCGCCCCCCCGCGVVPAVAAAVAAVAAVVCCCVLLCVVVVCLLLNGFLFQWNNCR